MKYYSEITKKIYDSEKDLKKAEFEIQKQNEEKEKLRSQRAERAKEVEAAYKKANELLDAFVNDYGSFHMTFADTDKSPFHNLFNMFF